MIICILPTGDWAEVNNNSLPVFITVPDNANLFEMSEDEIKQLANGEIILGESA